MRAGKGRKISISGNCTISKKKKKNNADILRLPEKVGCFFTLWQDTSPTLGPTSPCKQALQEERSRTINPCLYLSLSRGKK